MYIHMPNSQFLIQPDEQFILFILLPVCPLADNLYKATLNSLPGAFCLLNAGVLLVFVLLIFIAIRVWRVPLTSEDG